MQMQPIELKNVRLGGEFGRRIERIIEANILQIDLDETFLKAFRARGKGGYMGFGKFIDAVVRLAYATGDARLAALKENAITWLLDTQEADGYIGIIQDPEARVFVLWDLHESAYLIWALVTDHRLFGEQRSLQAAKRLADYLLGRVSENPDWRSQMLTRNFPDWSPQTAKAHGAFELFSLGLERALLALSSASNDPRYRDFVIEALKLHEYHNEADPPVRTGTTSMANHAYTRMYHAVAQLDLYRQAQDPRLLRSAHRILSFLRQGDGLLVTGSCSHWEAWHDTQSGLQNTSETCAAAYLARLMEAMLQVEGDSLYGDILERDIYNALFAATAPDGSKSRYYTPFDGKRPYDANPYIYCCANNNKRFLADLRSWIYYRTAGGFAINLYNASTATFTVAADTELTVAQETDYPTSGQVRITIDPSKPARFEVKLRIPRWCREATIAINASAPERISGGRFHRVERQWKPGDTIDLKMPMSWRFIRGRRSQVGRAAILRGPVIFTFNPARNPKLSADPGFEPRLIKIDPLEIEAPTPDDSVRPGGMSCTVKTWPHRQTGEGNPWPFPPDGRAPLVLSEYPDPGGESVYFMVPDDGASMLTDDELL